MQALYLDRMSQVGRPLVDGTIVVDGAGNVGFYNRRDMRAKP